MPEMFQENSKAVSGLLDDPPAVNTEAREPPARGGVRQPQTTVSLDDDSI